MSIQNNQMQNHDTSEYTFFTGINYHPYLHCYFTSMVVIICHPADYNLCYHMATQRTHRLFYSASIYQGVPGLWNNLSHMQPLGSAIKPLAWKYDVKSNKKVQPQFTLNSDNEPKSTWTHHKTWKNHSLSWPHSFVWLLLPAPNHQNPCVVNLMI